MKKIIDISYIIVDIIYFLKLNFLKRFLSLIFICALVPSNVLHSQNEDMAVKVKAQISEQGLKQYKKAEKFLSEAESFNNQANQLESSRKRKALKKQICASRSLGKANWIIYKIYREDLKKFTNIEQHDSAKTINKKLLRAKRLMRQSRNKREDALKANVPDNTYSILKHADELETKVFKNLHDVYALLLGETVKKQDKTENKLISKNELNSETQNEIIQEKPVIDNVNVNKAQPDSALSLNRRIDNPVNEVVANKVEADEEPSGPVYFKIQIAASKTQLSVEQLVKNFQTSEMLNVEQEGEWYKYMIRKKFSDYNEALEYKNNLKIKGAFIIAFKNNKRVSVEEALKKETFASNPVIKTENVKTDIETASAGSKAVYRLQVGLSTNPLTPVEVKEFKNGGKEVFMIDCGSWFIYVVGEFETKQAAMNFKTLKGMTDAEVVKFVNGKPIEE